MKHIEIFLLGVLLFDLCRNPASAQEQQPPRQAIEAQEQTPIANLLTIINIPARGLLCGMGSVLASIVMGASGGRRYADAATMIEESCAGPWIVTPEMISERQEQGKEKVSETPIGTSQP